MATVPRISTCMPFHGNAEEAVNHYVAVLPESRITSVQHYGVLLPEKVCVS